MTDAPSSDEDFDLFSKEMQDVKPLSLKKHRVDLHKGANQDLSSLVHRRRAATSDPKRDPNYLSTEHIPKRDPHDFLEYRKPGVQNGVYRKLRLGKYAIEARLDLHRKSLEQARQDVFTFVHDCIKYDLRTVMILHGKGDRGEDKAIIKSHVAYWLKQMPEVLAYHSAQRHHGGLGALYVILKKSDRKKQETRERLNNHNF
jgi:DNA-nicking Smr family endonuclease